MDEEIEQNPLFDDLPELDDILEQYNSAQEREIIDPEDRSEFVPTEEELIEDEAFLPNVHFEPVESDASFRELVQQIHEDLGEKGGGQLTATTEPVPDGWTPGGYEEFSWEDRATDPLADIQATNELLHSNGLPLIEVVPEAPPGLLTIVPATPEPPTPGTVEYRVWMGYSADDPILQARNDDSDGWMCACGVYWLIEEMPIDDDLKLKFCSECGLTGAEAQERIRQKREILKDSPIPTDKALSADELIAIANEALEKIEGEKRAQKLNKYRERMSRGADLRHPVNTADYVQARIIEGGCGEADCPICLGNTCRYCGFGCWDQKGSPTCNHDIRLRHIWDATKEEYRKGLIEAELISLGMSSEIKRLEMLAQIFDGEPNKGGSADFCYKCNKSIGMGVMVVTTSRGRYHAACPESKDGTQKQTGSTAPLGTVAELPGSDSSEEAG